MEFDYDLVVIGSGPAGEKAAVAGAWYGKRVAVVERSGLGGICVHNGTLPSKSIRESALHLAGLRDRGIEGLRRAPLGAVLVSDLLAHKENVCRLEEKEVGDDFARNGITLLRGSASLTGPNSLTVTAADGAVQAVTAEIILLATGTHPRRPAGIPFETEEVYDSDEILGLETVPRSMIVLGGGVIGCEYASIFAALGVEVTLVEPRDRFLGFLDEEIGDALVAAFTGMGIALRMGTRFTGVAVLAPDEVAVTLAGGEVLRAERVLVAAGREGNTAGLGLETAGVALDERGLVKVDAHYRSSTASIFAAGDLIGFPALASTSMEQGRVAVQHAFGLRDKEAVGSLLPLGVYTIPEVSMVGDTEAVARARGDEVEVGRALFSENARGRINGARDGMLKLVFRVSDAKVLGVHIVGEQATELVHIGMMAMSAGATLRMFTDCVFNFPTLSEAYRHAAYDGLARLARRAKGAQG